MTEYINNYEKLHQSLVKAVKVLHEADFSVTEIAALLHISEAKIRVLK